MTDRSVIESEQAPTGIGNPSTPRSRSPYGIGTTQSSAVGKGHRLARAATKARTSQSPRRHRGAEGVTKPATAQREQRQWKRREAILAAALEEFSSAGFAAARLDDVARRAGVAKGTIYLYFKDKEDLFQELVRAMLSPVVGALEAAERADLSARAVAEGIAELFVREIFGTRRQDVIRLIIAEGPRFPKLAEFYYREVIERVTAAMRTLMKRALARGELSNDALARFPQLLVAPALVAVVWGSLFEKFAPLDARELLRAHIEILFGGKGAR
jgi:AcrR family transcriptional regulator